jgi:hypothetical protein
MVPLRQEAGKSFRVTTSRTTIVLALIRDSWALMAELGDSRASPFQDGKQ